MDWFLYDNGLRHERVKVVSVQYSLVDNQYQRKSEVLHTLMSNKCYAYQLNFKSSNLMFLKTYTNTEFHDVIITCTDENSRLLEIEDKICLTLLINK